MDRGAWRATVHGVAKEPDATRDYTTTTVNVNDSGIYSKCDGEEPFMSFNHMHGVVKQNPK